MNEMRNFFCRTLAAILLFPAAAEARELTLWPSGICEARAHRSCTVATAPDRALLVETGTDYAWPGVTVFFKDGLFDLSAYDSLAVTLSNRCDRPLDIHLSVKNRPDQGSSPGGVLSLAPGSSGVLSVRLINRPWVLDRPLELVGMRGYPEAIDGGKFNVRQTAELHVFLNNPPQAAAFAVLTIAAQQRERRLKTLDAGAFLPFVDRFGQFRHDDWPGKIHSEEELRAAALREERALDASEPPAAFNRWGGWTGGPQLEATGHFRTAKLNGLWWLVDPDGRLFFSHGVTCVRDASFTGIQHREQYFEWLPEPESAFAAFYGWNSWAPHGFYKDKGRHRTYCFARANMLRKYGENWREIYKDLAHRRIQSWGLNTIANWSDSDVYLMRRTPYTVSLGTWAPPIEGSEGWWGKFSDPFHPDFSKSIADRIAGQTQSANDPWCIGYFVDNELSWGRTDASLGEAAVKSPAAQPAKKAAWQWLIARYGEIARLNASWGTQYASAEDFLEQRDVPATDAAKRDLAGIHELIATEYFSTIRDALKRGAPDKLYLGCRFAAGSPASYRVASRFCDVVSFNNYRRTVEKDLPAGSEDRPLINGEFHFGALDRGIFHTGLVPVADQQERALAYKEFVTSCLRHPRYVGTHWFQWRDQPLTGRGDGENYQIGFLTETDQPHPELVGAARAIAETMYETRSRMSKP
jgi:hypothetical protein